MVKLPDDDATNETVAKARPKRLVWCKKGCGEGAPKPLRVISMWIDSGANKRSELFARKADDNARLCPRGRLVSHLTMETAGHEFPALMQVCQELVVELPKLRTMITDSVREIEPPESLYLPKHPSFVSFVSCALL